MPKLSIITINYNNVQGLKKTMQSVFSQTFNEFEYIVVDGAAPLNPPDRGTLLSFVDKEFDKHNGFTRCTWLSPFGGVGGGFFSEPDTGIYNAMNKGIRMATGDYLLFLNSGDLLASDDVIERVLPYLNNGNEIVSGELELVKSNTDNIKLFPPQTVHLNYCISAGLTHPNTFIKRELFDKYGYYNEKNKIISDWEFFLIACGLYTCKYQAIPVLISYFAMDGLSSQNEELLKQETQEALKRLLPRWKKLERFIRQK